MGAAGDRAVGRQGWTCPAGRVSADHYAGAGRRWATRGRPSSTARSPAARGDEPPPARRARRPRRRSRHRRGSPHGAGAPGRRCRLSYDMLAWDAPRRPPAAVADIRALPCRGRRRRRRRRLRPEPPVGAAPASPSSSGSPGQRDGARRCLQQRQSQRGPRPCRRRRSGSGLAGPRLVPGAEGKSPSPSWPAPPRWAPRRAPPGSLR